MNYKIVGKYIKKLNFNIPNTKTFFQLTKDIANYKINIDIKSNQIKQNLIEVIASINLTPTKEDFEKINTEIDFAAIVEISNNKIEKDEIERIVLVSIPSEIYGDLRKIFVGLFENSGFRDIKISENVDFQKLYDMRKVQ
jgi:preprotein translocase subunit SecB|tara:strand:- start:686 stop:1105 length:420 start_codon:yes stop_codon:yes gene_type:complete